MSETDDDQWSLDSSRCFQELQTAMSDPRVVDVLTVEDPNQRVTKLRKLGLDVELISDVLEVSDTRKRAATKFPDATALWMTGRSFEQASSHLIAEWKAQRLFESINELSPDSPITRRYVVVDLCCGMGADALAFAQKFPTLLVDRDPRLIQFANANLLGARPSFPFFALCNDVHKILDVMEQSVGSEPTMGELAKGLTEPVRAWCHDHELQDHQLVWHLDPDRRSGKGRHIRLEDFSPNRSFMERLFQVCPKGLLKVAPATSLPVEWAEKSDWNWLGEDGECKQLLGLFGFGTGKKQATVWNRHLGNWESCSSGNGQPTLATQPLLPEGFLIEFHSAVRSSGLQDELAQAIGAYPVQHDYYYQTETDDRLDDSVLYSVFRIVKLLPARARKIEAELRQRGLRLTEIKKLRAPAEMQQRLIRELRSSFSADGQPASMILVQQPQNGKVQAVLVHRRP